MAERAAPEAGTGSGGGARSPRPGSTSWTSTSGRASADTRPELPFVPGAEGAGTVTAVGEGVTGLAVGDQVAWAGPGQRLCRAGRAAADRVVPVPSGISRAGRRGGHAAGHDRALPGHQHVPGPRRRRRGGARGGRRSRPAADPDGQAPRRHRDRHHLRRREGRSRRGSRGGPRRRLRRVPRRGRRVTGGPARTWSTTASARPPSTTAWPRCARAA